MKKLLLTLMALMFAVQAQAGLYGWTDDRGNRHYTDDEKKIPEKYRDQAQEPALKDPVIESDYRLEATASAEPEEEVYGGKPILQWVQEINQMEMDLIEARDTEILLEDELQSLKHIKVGVVRRNPVVGKFYTRLVSRDSGLYYIDENEIKLLDMKLSEVRNKVKTIEQEIEIFREEAKKAAVPPKYL
jgi:hypothetical protein